MGGWWGDYSFRCQPVDYSNSPTATRVSGQISKKEKMKHNTLDKFNWPLIYCHYELTHCYIFTQFTYTGEGFSWRGWLHMYI